MAKVKSANRVLDSYTIAGTKKIVKAGDCVLIRPHKANVDPYVGRVEQIETDNRNDLKVRVRWYYRPEETLVGRLPFHGAKELFLSDHIDLQSAQCIFETCVVYTFKEYTKLKIVDEEDYFCRFEYYPRTKTFIPNQIQVYCICKMPYNPDDLVVQCDHCVDWFHPKCVDMKLEEATEVNHFVCPACVDKELKANENQFVSPRRENPSIHNDEPSSIKTLDYFKARIANAYANKPAFSRPSIIKKVNKCIALGNGQSDNSSNQDVKEPEDMKRPLAPAKCKGTPKRQKN